jgi:hypothetical protein
MHWLQLQHYPVRCPHDTNVLHLLLPGNGVPLVKPHQRCLAAKVSGTPAEKVHKHIALWEKKGTYAAPQRSTTSPRPAHCAAAAASTADEANNVL